MLEKLGGRKMVIGVFTIVLGVAIDFTFGLSSNLLQLITFVSVGYFLGNAGEHLAKAKKPKPEEDPVNVNLINSHNILNQRIDSVEKTMKNINDLAGKLQENTHVTNKALTSVMDMLKLGSPR